MYYVHIYEVYDYFFITLILILIEKFNYALSLKNIPNPNNDC